MRRRNGPGTHPPHEPGRRTRHRSGGEGTDVHAAHLNLCRGRGGERRGFKLVVSKHRFVLPVREAARELRKSELVAGPGSRWHAVRVLAFVDYGLYISATGALSAMYRQDVFSNNLANLDTVGFKPDLPLAKQRAAEQQDSEGNLIESNELLERLGAGVNLAPNRTSFAQGSLRSTGAPLDLGIQGDGFFVVRDPNATTEDGGVRLTRDGRFLRSREGKLVNSSGLPVLDESGSPISIPSTGKLSVDAKGVIRSGYVAVGALRVVSIPDPGQLVKEGASLFRAPDGVLDDARPASGMVRQGTVEESSVDEVSTIMRITSASRDAESNFGMIAQADRLNERVINTFGRVS